MLPPKFFSNNLQMLRARRLFFACTHVALRASEVPIWLNVGFEVVPEEVDTGVLNRIEALSYDDATRHSVLQHCHEISTLSPEQYRIASRARLRQRKGLVNRYERDLFNACFDVIYVATDLETAVNVKRWFRGEVAYRYFGRFENLKDIRDLAQAYSQRELRDIICLPIFNSLYELDIPKIFRRSSVIHGLVLPHALKEDWSSPHPDQSAIVVMNDVKEGTEQCEILRGMLSLAHQIPIKILGKNRLDQVPADIRANMRVTGILERKEFLAQIAGCRMLIHPYAERYHNHYTNLEAVAKGVPVLFRTENPLFFEQPDFVTEIHPASWYGAHGTAEELFAAAVALFDQTEMLVTLAQRQKILLDIFSEQNVFDEINIASSVFRKRARKLLDRGKSFLSTDHAVFLHARVPCAEPIRIQDGLGRIDKTVPLYSLALEDDWNSLSNNADGDLVIRISGGKRQYVIGYEERLPPGIYRFQMRGHIPTDVALKLTLEIFHDEDIIAAKSVAFIGGGSLDLPAAELSSDRPWLLSIWLETFSGGYVDISTLHLSCTSNAIDGSYISIDHSWLSLINRPIPATLVAALNNDTDSQYLPLNRDSPLPISSSIHEKPTQLIIGRDPLLDPGEYRLELSGLSVGQTTLSTNVEIIENTDIAAALNTFSFSKDRTSLLTVDFCIDRPSALALYLRAHGRGSIALTSLRLTSESRGMAPASIYSMNGVSQALIAGVKLPAQALFPAAVQVISVADYHVEGLPLSTTRMAQAKLPSFYQIAEEQSYELECYFSGVGHSIISLTLEIWTEHDIIKSVSSVMPFETESANVIFNFTLRIGKISLTPVLFLRTSPDSEIVLTHVRLQRIGLYNSCCK